MRTKGKGLYSSIAITAAVIVVAVGGALLFYKSVRRILRKKTNSLGEIAEQSVMTLRREVQARCSRCGISPR